MIKRELGARIVNLAFEGAMIHRGCAAAPVGIRGEKKKNRCEVIELRATLRFLDKKLYAGWCVSSVYTYL